MKAKSDYVLNPLSSSAIAAMLSAVAAVLVGGIAVLCDAYGGAIADVAAADSAFPRRAGTQYCIQYFSSCLDPADTPSHLANVANVYAAMRPYVPGVAYVNYCDLDLKNWADAYWVQTSTGCRPSRRLMTLTNHAQSVPLAQ